MSKFEQQWQHALAEYTQAGLLREPPLLQSAQGVQIRVDGQSVLSFASNDYLGLANHPELTRACSWALETVGFGGGASHLVCGHQQEHELLERELADFTGREQALVFSSGYMANLAVISTLAKAKDLILQDKLNHASLLDGAKLSGARMQRYLHGDVASLERYFERFSKRLSEQYSDANTLVVTDGVFSMDGDTAPLDKLAEQCQRRDALLIVDDAHGLGVLGQQGRGTVDAYGMNSVQVPVLIGTFGKAFGSAGAFVAGSTSLISYLKQFARPYIYTTSMPPAAAAATRAALALIRSEHGDNLRAKLQDNIAYFKACANARSLPLMPSDTAIQPVLLGSAQETISVAKFLRRQGILVGAIRPPTVPNNSARLRITICANHSQAMLDRLFEVLDQALVAATTG